MAAEGTNTLITKEISRKDLVSKFGKSGSDTGRTEVQIALLTKRINELTSHFKTHSKDHHSRQGLFKLVGQRKRHLKYLAKEDLNRYSEVLVKLGLRK
jgi:small subunit ribosomal protein S15